MDLAQLAAQLRDSDPRRRVEALRILAMVEETRALEAVRWLYQNDPESGVREVAYWAGSLLWQAQQRGHSTELALDELFGRKQSSELQEQFIDNLSFNLPQTKNSRVRRFAADMEYWERLNDALLGKPEPEDEPPPILPAQLIPPSSPSASPSAPPADDDLLDAGLSELFSE
ncbi:MAG TPA: HEAT repeat domain-containing protein [Aggregatilineaceae bacterium]|nr:HEAT repeat domain-containing protein [Aggregatilineaceae bacterium]